MRAWWGGLSLRARLALAFGTMATAVLVFVVALIARTHGADFFKAGKIVPALVVASVVFFAGGWLVAGWCLREIGRLAAKAGGADEGGVPAELEGLAALLRKEARRRDELLQEMRRFTADVAHELRTPLTAIRVTGEVAMQTGGGATALRDALETILEETRRMADMIERLLRLARLESDRLALNIRRISLLEYLLLWRAGLAVLAEEKGQDIQIRCPPGLAVMADPDLLEQGVVNVLFNAICHTPPGGIIILDTRAGAGADCVELAISDDGPGIPEAHVEDVFERFYRLDNNRGNSGFGLGLCIARTALRRMRGDLRAGNAAGRGAMFTFSLPAPPEGGAAK